MPETWLISDTHFGHENIIKYCDRPFANAKEMDEFMETAWNETVADDDTVYHLGDVYFAGKSGRDIVPRLKGRKKLILGNHDKGLDRTIQRCFQRVMAWHKMPELGILLTHVPVHPSQFARYKSPTREGFVEGMRVNVHGHIHEKILQDMRYLNMCVEQWHYRPTNLDEVAAMVKLRISKGLC